MKQTFTPASYSERVRESWAEFTRGGGEGNYRQPVRTPEEVAQRRIGDAERIACTLLSDIHVLSDELRELAERLASDVTCTEYPSIALMESIVDREELPEDVAEWPKANRKWATAENFAVWALGVALVDHRLKGEPDADTTTGHFGGFVNVTTSLAAAVAEYHERRVEASARYTATIEGKI